jgi:Leucine-rich repeat (LRR) protein/GTPase SAR1 family protein
MAHDFYYRQAEEKIEDARQSGKIELDLGRMVLTQVPESLGQLVQLRSLILRGNLLKTLPESIEQLVLLENLNLSGNNLTVSPESLGRIEKLTRLQSLILSNNQLSMLPDSIQPLIQLRSLHLSSNQLIVIPEWLTQLPELQDLDLSGNQLKTLPTLISGLTKLQTLKLANNQLSTLPEWFGQLLNLRELILSNNNISTLPESFSQLVQLQSLNLFYNQLTILPEWFGSLTNLRLLTLAGNKLRDLPESLSQLKKLQTLRLSGSGESNPLNKIPEVIRKMTRLEELWLEDCQIEFLPDWLGELSELRNLPLHSNRLTDLPVTLLKLSNLSTISLHHNPLNPELAAAYAEGLTSVKRYLHAKATAQITLNEAKLILVGEGEVGKTCLMDALLDKPWQEHPSTHGIEIQQVKVINSYAKTEITLNGWDFGGQRVYRPTHQLFFSAPAVYLVVWKPREGPQQGFVKEWIQLIKRREPSAKILVVATHGGPKQRQPDIDRQELWDLFGKETVIDFFFVDSKPDKKGRRKNIKELKQAIASVAATLPEVGRSVPKSFADARAALQATGAPYLPFDKVLNICRAHNMENEIARLFITISHRLGHLTHYENDPTLRDIVILRPDWLATAMSYVLDDEETRTNQGLVKFSRLSLLWNDPARPANTRYPASLHRIFLRLMERFDLSYRVAGISKNEDSNPVSLIAQLVPDTTPKETLDKAWAPKLAPGDTTGDVEQTQICRIVDVGNSQSANAEGLFYQLIVRLHKFSLGRAHWDDSVHWQRGLVLDADYNGRALLRHIGNDVHITVRAPFPERFLGMLTEEVKFLVESFWEGLRCDVTVPCLATPDCKGLFEVSKLIENKKRHRLEQPCSICNEWQNIDQLLSNAPAAIQSISLEILVKEFAEVKDKLDEVNDNTRRILSQVDKQYADLIQIFTDEAREGPRLFSFFPFDGSNFNPQTWTRAKFRLVLWCEHSRLPLPAINGIASKKGVYDLEFDREWFRQAVPYLKFLTGTLSLVLPVMASTFKAIDDTAFKTLENQISLGKNVIDAIAGEGAALYGVMGETDPTNLELGVKVRAENATLRELHALLKAKDPGFGGLVRVMNKRQEFLWVHEKFASEY